MPVATACANIALVKYWGKRDASLNLPAAGSLSVTVDALKTWTEVELVPALAEHELVPEGWVAGGRALERVRVFMDRVRARAASERGRMHARVRSRSAFPVASGLASSASGFAALAVAAADAYGVPATPAELSVLARLGSGSAARSIFGGFVRMDAGVSADGSDAFARPIEDAPIVLSAAVAVVKAGPKKIGSTAGMEATRRTSPYHESWIAQVDVDLIAAEQALRDGAFDELAGIVEGNCLAMHANAMAARPGIIYFSGTTLWAIDRVRQLRASGVPAMFTVDAGPHVVAFTPPEHLDAVATSLGEHPEIDQVIRSPVGPAAALTDRFAP